jgi:Tfp pilus assembly protein PilF
MLRWTHFTRLFLGLPLLALASCRPGTDVGLEPTPPLPSTGVVISAWHQGLCFLVSRDDRLMIASAQVVSAQEELEVIFPVVEDGKIKSRHDLAVIQVTSVPEGVPELKLATANPAENTPVQTVLDSGSKVTLWAPRSTTVAGVTEVAFGAANGQRVSGPMVELALEGKYTKGSAGAPVIDESGQVVTVLTTGSARPRALGIEVAEANKLLSLAYQKMGTTVFNEACRKLELPKKEDAKKELEAAIGLFDKSLAINAKDAITYNERGAALSYLNRFDEAIKQYTKAVELNPQLARAYRNRASAYLHEGDSRREKGDMTGARESYDKAVADCTKAIDRDPKYIAAYERRSVAYTKLGKTDEAKRDLEAVTELSKPIWTSSGLIPDR